MASERRVRTIAHRLSGETPTLPDEGRLPSFDRATAWINSAPRRRSDLAGRVVLVSFWTYTCVNWLRTLPYLNAWNAKYASDGLTIVGVHTPEFGFEREQHNVAHNVAELGIEFPVAVDTNYGVWEDFANHYWPAIYLADSAGRIRFHHFGEGEYEMTEMAIQQLLSDAGDGSVDPGLVAVRPAGLQVAADWDTLRSPETYLGYGQSSGFASENPALFDLPHEYESRGDLTLNSWDLAGNWTVARHASVLNRAGGRVAFAFHARDVNLVMAPGAAGASIPFRVYLDGRLVDSEGGADVDGSGHGAVDEPKTYQLIRQHQTIADRVIEVEFLEAGVEAYCMTFG